MISSMRDLERTWNSKFNYPWTFFNDVEFSEDFIRLTQMETKAKCNYGKPLSRCQRSNKNLSTDVYLHRGHTKRALGSPSLDK